ncbi:MAG: DNA internalization-related competence protein ComEC/Rec2 [Myxococcales bacterium]|nr:DNA internalization-related competence protein ComEC/Rec2 [Polyangiaceae bacterium]MDW8249754.1 DNA internalization-related competence protein ComEC/Rec2 [Myxococcales bacterium]
MDAVLVVGLVVLAGQRASVQPGSVALVLAGAWLLLRRRLPGWLVMLALLCGGLSWARSWYTLRQFDEQVEAARSWLGVPARCAARVRVISSPVRKGDALRWLGKVEALDCEGREAPAGGIIRLYGGPADLARGDRVEATISVGAIQLFHNLDLPDPRAGAARSGAVLSGSILAVEVLERGRGPGAWIDRARTHVRARIEATYPAAAAPLGRALVLGEEDLEPEESEAFRRSGLSHLLAVSGTHLMLVVAGLVGVLREALVAWTSLPARGLAGPVAAGFGVPLAVLYADFSGGSGSAWRAAAMLGVMLGAEVLGRRGHAPRALGLSLLLLALREPLAAFDLSLLLSGAATAGLLWLTPPILARMPERLPRWLAEPLTTTLAATLACAPLLTLLSSELPLAGLLANLLAVPVGELAALPLCILHTILAGPAERGAAVLGSGALLVVRWIAHQAAAVPGLPVPPMTELHGVALALGGVAVAVAHDRRQTALLTGAALLVVEVGAVRSGSPRGALRVTILDVGQGDSLLVDFPDGRAMLVDGGGFVGSPVDPGKSVILPTLRARRRKELAVVALSHPHPDHFLGLASAVPSLKIGEFWDSGQGEAEGAGPVYGAMMAGLRGRGVAVQGPRDLCGKTRHFGDARVELLAPCPSIKPFVNANDNSLVLKVSLGDRTALLVGDAEEQEEHELLARYGHSLKADLLKVGHHGSRTSTKPEFLAAVSPGLAVISCGTRNRFGHPHPITLATLEAARVPTVRTDRGGALLWSTDGRNVSILQAKPR